MAVEDGTRAGQPASGSPELSFGGAYDGLLRSSSTPGAPGIAGAGFALAGGRRRRRRTATPGVAAPAARAGPGAAGAGGPGAAGRRRARAGGATASSVAGPAAGPGRRRRRSAGRRGARARADGSASAVRGRRGVGVVRRRRDRPRCVTASGRDLLVDLGLHLVELGLRLLGELLALSRNPMPRRYATAADGAGLTLRQRQRHGLRRCPPDASPSAAIRSAIVRSVKACGVSDGSATSSHVTGADTGAPGRPRTA